MGRPQSFCFGPRGRNGCSCNLPLSAVRTPCIYNRAKGIGPVLPPRRRLHHPATISFRYVSVPRLLALVAVFFESRACSRRLKSCSRLFHWFPSRRSLLGHSSSFESSEALVAAVRILALVTEEMRDHTPGPLDMRLLSIAPRVFSRGSNNSLPLHL